MNIIQILLNQLLDNFVCHQQYLQYNQFLQPIIFPNKLDFSGHIFSTAVRMHSFTNVCGLSFFQQYFCTLHNQLELLIHFQESAFWLVVWSDFLSWRLSAKCSNFHRSYAYSQNASQYHILLHINDSILNKTNKGTCFYFNKIIKKKLDFFFPLSLVHRC